MSHFIQKYMLKSYKRQKGSTETNHKKDDNCHNKTQENTDREYN